MKVVLIDHPYEVSRETNFLAGEKTGKNTDRFRVLTTLKSYFEQADQVY